MGSICSKKLKDGTNRYYAEICINQKVAQNGLLHEKPNLKMTPNSF